MSTAASNVIVIARDFWVGGMMRCCIVSIQADTTTPNEDGETITCIHCGATIACINGAWKWSPSEDNPGETK